MLETILHCPPTLTTARSSPPTMRIFTQHRAPSRTAEVVWLQITPCGSRCIISSQRLQDLRGAPGLVGAGIGEPLRSLLGRSVAPKRPVRVSPQLPFLWERPHGSVHAEIGHMSACTQYYKPSERGALSGSAHRRTSQSQALTSFFCGARTLKRLSSSRSLR